MERRFPKASESLNDVFVFLDGVLAAEAASASAAYAVSFAVEELFTNMVKYSRGSRNDVAIDVERNGDRLVIRMVEDDVEPFDTTHWADPETTRSLSERKVGGLGIHLLRQLVDELHYDYEGRRGTTTIMKRLGH